MFISNDWETRAERESEPYLARVAEAKRKLSRLGEEDLQTVAEAAIQLLDELRDPDEDHCLAGDEGCGRFLGGERRGTHWGSQSEATGPEPEYGVDQREILTAFGNVQRVD